MPRPERHPGGPRRRGRAAAERLLGGGGSDGGGGPHSRTGGRGETPLNLSVREADEWPARKAGLDSGKAVRDLAAPNTSPGDRLLKTFGVPRHGRVIFYDYDELERITDCVFRDLPAGGDEDMAEDPSFYVGPHDIFPEEFLPFLGLRGRVRESFLQAHGDLLTARWWRDVQERLRGGEIVDIYPYREDQRLYHAWR